MYKILGGIAGLIDDELCSGVCARGVRTGIAVDGFQGNHGGSPEACSIRAGTLLRQMYWVDGSPASCMVIQPPSFPRLILVILADISIGIEMVTIEARRPDI